MPANNSVIRRIMTIKESPPIRMPLMDSPSPELSTFSSPEMWIAVARFVDEEAPDIALTRMT